MKPTKRRSPFASAHALVAVWGVLAGSTAGCGEPDAVSAGPAACTAGQSRACTCADNSPGAAACDANGVAGVCQCAAANAGNGGANPGMSGVGGASGMSSGGMGGAGGTAGIPVAGTTGGTAGAAGMIMTGGIGGESGMTGGTAGTMMTGGTGGAGTGGTGDEGVPAGEYCSAAATWDPAWAEFEEEVLRLTNEVRATGADCGEHGVFGATGPLTMSATLRCSSRLHSMDMGVQNYFAHDALDGRDPFDRMADAGYSGGTMGENIAKGQQTPAEVVDGWVDSDGHCMNIMNPDFTVIGVGYWEGEADSMFFNGNKLWTQNFGGPGFTGGRN